MRQWTKLVIPNATRLILLTRLSTLGGSVRHLRFVPCPPCGDLGPPRVHGASKLLDLGRAALVTHVGGELFDPLEGELLVAVGRTARGRLPIRYPALGV